MKEGGWERREQAVAMVRKVCTFDEDEQIHCISSEYLGLRTAETAEDSKGLEVIRRWDLGELKIGDPRSVPIESVDASVQGLFIRDVLVHYLSDSLGTISADPSPWGTRLPLIIELSSGERLLYDGTHRWAAAKLLGRRVFTAQILSAKGDTEVDSALSRPDR